jgi:large subunit ribosomal protein L24
MKKKFNRNWKKSVKPNKQRKYRNNAPIHIKSKLISSHLSKQLREKYNKRSFRLRKGDKVEIMRGQFRGKQGKVQKVDVKNERVFISKIEIQKKDGTRTFYPIHPSNLKIIELDLSDKKRLSALKRSKVKEK